MQVIQQMLFLDSLEIHPVVTFSQPLQVDELTSQGESLFDGILQQARQLFAEHTQGLTASQPAAQTQLP